MSWLYAHPLAVAFTIAGVSIAVAIAALEWEAIVDRAGRLR